MLDLFAKSININFETVNYLGNENTYMFGFGKNKIFS